MQSDADCTALDDPLRPRTPNFANFSCFMSCVPPLLEYVIRDYMTQAAPVYTHAHIACANSEAGCTFLCSQCGANMHSPQCTAQKAHCQIRSEHTSNTWSEHTNNKTCSGMQELLNLKCDRVVQLTVLVKC